MRIDAYNKITQMLQTNNTVKTAKAKGVSAKDHVEISRTGQDYQVAKQALAHAEDIRMDKVNDIKRRMESGTYNVTGEEVANKLVENYFNQII
ncbi:flagellar biosynthesis anti-sigma factor FlgM [Anaerocolumna sp.]|uniref:flagellar biosynthesis anti-sigma factor FlgM n=1 Tax=Anaerocolumna sp. TaxID=2041569 RepID=UPI0028A718B3|nr:flagellar biosynthesis anti-sigma factor FlgM [Anaerocolumna sp.]